MRIAIVADWLTTFGGAEHVIAEMLQVWPDADLFATVANPQQLGPITGHSIRTTKLQRRYRLLGSHQPLLTWMPRAVEDIDLRGYDVIVSSSHAVAKGIIPPSSAVHICYCHTPVRYGWEMEEQYLDDFRVPKFLRKWVSTKLREIRRWDLTTAKRVDVFIANSSIIAERIERTYARKSIVIAPPVEDRFFKAVSCQLSADSSQEYFLAVGRLVPYKRFDILIQTANTLHLPLKIAGNGQDKARLQKLAGPTVEFLGFVPDEELPSLYAGATALLFPQEEDAGIVLLEAQASGTPAIAYRKGGALDVIQEGKTGIFFEEQSTQSLEQALSRFEKLTWNREEIRDAARQFHADRFREQLRDAIEKSLLHPTRR